MNSFVEAQNSLKRMSYAGCVTRFKTRQSHAVRFSFIPVVMKSPGLKPIEAQNARSSSACVRYLAVANSVWGEPDCSVAIKNALAIERRGGRGGGGTAMLVRPVGRDQRPWNKGLLIGQKKPLEPKHVWSIRVRLEIARSWRNLVIFNLAIDSKLRACDLVKLRVDDICLGARVRHRATIVQKKTGRPVQFEITEQSRGPLRPGYQCSGPLAPDISSQVDFTQGPTSPPVNMPGWCIAGLKASA